MGLEPTTFCLGSRHSTAELHPHADEIIVARGGVMRASRGSEKGTMAIGDRNEDEPLPLAVIGRETPIGEFRVAASTLGVLWAGVGEEDDLVSYAGIRGYFVRDGDSRPKALAERAALQIEEYFDGRRRTFAVPLDFGPTTAFTAAVLHEVAKRIPFGTTATYGDVGEQAGKARAARAVGNIMAQCPISIIVPCHRVIHADGAVGGYSRSDPAAGRRRKAWLLDFEAELTRSRPSHGRSSTPK
jgi:methylated-DNA-[protein]-cysteine S-methyltransferase